jgi:hypothetical protein
VFAAATWPTLIICQAISSAGKGCQTAVGGGALVGRMRVPALSGPKGSERCLEKQKGPGLPQDLFVSGVSS